MRSRRTIRGISLSKRVLRLLQDYECRNTTYVAPDGSWPIVWRRARGAEVEDADGRRYLDLTAAFGVAAAGHANPRVVRAGRLQMGRLLHAMGDVHPHPLKAELARKLSKITFERWADPTRLCGKALFGNSGFEAVEAALKTAMLATGKPGVLAFEGAYHGLGYGTLNPTHRDLFRSPFRSQLAEFARFVPFPVAERALAGLEALLHRLFRRHRIGAILVEPVQGRAGVRVPPLGFLALLRRVCDEHRALLILDEVYTGFGRTGAWFACEHSKTVPDLICLGKALTGGFPLSACVGGAELMDAAWPKSDGEAIHTSTYLGHPVGCAMALAQIEEIARLGLVDRSAALGNALTGCLRRLRGPAHLRLECRGLGLMAGVELLNASFEPATDAALHVVKEMLHQGFILLPEGERSNVISFTPPLTISARQLNRALVALQSCLDAVPAGRIRRKRSPPRP